MKDALFLKYINKPLQNFNNGFFREGLFLGIVIPKTQFMSQFVELVDCE